MVNENYQSDLKFLDQEWGKIEAEKLKELAKTDAVGIEADEEDAVGIEADEEDDVDIQAEMDHRFMKERREKRRENNRREKMRENNRREKKRENKKRENERKREKEEAEKMIAAVEAVRVRGDSIGGTVTCIVRNFPWSGGSRAFREIVAVLLKGVMSLPGTESF